MGRSAVALAGAVVLSATLAGGAAPARATGFYGYGYEAYDGPVLVEDRLVRVRLTPALRQRLASSGYGIRRARYTGFGRAGSSGCHRRAGYGPEFYPY